MLFIACEAPVVDGQALGEDMTGSGDMRGVSESGFEKGSASGRGRFWMG